METIISSRYYDIVYKISSLTGMWPYLKPKTRAFRIVLFTIILLTILVPQVTTWSIHVHVCTCTYTCNRRQKNSLEIYNCNRHSFFQLAYQFMCKKNLHCTFQAMTAYLLSTVAILKVYTFQFNTCTVRFERFFNIHTCVMIKYFWVFQLKRLQIN